MNLAERSIEGCRIYAAALAAPGLTGVNAAVVVMTCESQTQQRREVFRDECLLDGRVWLDPQVALEFALEAGHAAIVAQRALGAQLSGGRTSLGGYEAKATKGTVIATTRVACVMSLRLKL